MAGATNLRTSITESRGNSEHFSTLLRELANTSICQPEIGFGTWNYSGEVWNRFWPQSNTTLALLDAAAGMEPKKSAGQSRVNEIECSQALAASEFRAARPNHSRRKKPSATDPESYRSVPAGPISQFQSRKQCWRNSWMGRSPSSLESAIWLSTVIPRVAVTLPTVCLSQGLP